MLYFIMYDIQNDKVRTHTIKYLLRQGCCRVQKSIFVGNLKNDKVKAMNLYFQSQSAHFENEEDSIVMIPVPTDYINSINAIGKSIDLQTYMVRKNTLIF